MKLKLISPIDALSKAYFKQTLTDGELEKFAANVREMLDNFNDKESEEHNKNLVRDFLLNTYYRDKYAVNTKDKDDLVIHHDKKADSDVAVIIETKKRTNKVEMISAVKPNAKAFHELIYYYLKERYTNGQNDIKNLIATNGYEWFIFDEVWFEKNIYRDSGLKKAYLEFKPSGNDTRHFYDNVAAVFLNNYEGEIPCTYINLEETFKQKKPGKKEIKALYKLFAPEHLLKKPFANDSNLLNKDFYYELLYILGLEEKKDGSKKLIDRAGKTRTDASLLENTISRLQTGSKWKNVNNLSGYGESDEQQIFSIALELCINWLNRVLFLKLLEGQLIRYQATAAAKKDEAAFLNIDTIKDYDELNELFFEVLAKPTAERDNSVKNEFRKIPYLNSSLFEPGELEQVTIEISNLKDRLEMPLLSNTVLKDGTKRKTGKLHTLEYLFKFLDAYDFSSDENDEAQRDSKPIITAAVLGLIFEKINGYKDGSFFTPSFITMYMSRESLRRAVVQKFNDTYKEHEWNCNTLDEVYNQIIRSKVSIKEANEAVNSLKICDPAVGSGHFLVSALNELIVIKYELQILADKNFKLIGGYNLTIERDELILMRGLDFFSYNYTDPESQRVQETLFREKQTLIENCLFGVDINPKSVMICRLRLWIELLKNAYYSGDKPRELQTLPNIDINIKCGNSLISKLQVDDQQNNFDAARRQLVKRILPDYKIQVELYKSVKDKAAKQVIVNKINAYKKQFENLFNPSDKGYLKFREAENEWYLSSTKLLKDNTDVTEVLYQKYLKAKEDYDLKMKVYERAFEWRFEFPEVLNNEGQFIGFDIVIGNPPYIPLEAFDNTTRDLFRVRYPQFERKFETSVLFIVRGFTLLKSTGILSYIAPATWQTGENYNKFRKYLIDEKGIEKIINLPFDTFEDAYVDTSVYVMFNYPQNNYGIFNFGKKDNITDLNTVSFSEINVSSINAPNYKLILDKNAGDLVARYSNNKFISLGLITKSTQGLSGSNFTKANGEIKEEDLFPFLSRGNVYNYLLSKEEVYYTNLKDKKTLKQFYEAQPKILIRRIINRQNRLSVGYCDEKLVFKKDINPFIVIDERFSAKFLLGILASNFISYLYLKSSSIATKDDFRQTTLAEIRAIPIPIIDQKKQLPIISLANKILGIKNERPDSDTGEWEWQIEALVFNLYGLDDTETLLVLNSFSDLSAMAKEKIMNHLQDIRSGRFRVKI